MYSDVIALFELSPLSFYFVVVLFSLVIGSFLNVVIYRLPKMMEQGWIQECRDFLADEIAANDMAAEKSQASKQKPTPEAQQILTLSKPNSSCPHCQHQIRFYENIPIISWLFLRGRCSQCKEKISFRYPAIELVTALLSCVVASVYGVNAITLFVLLLTWALVCLTMIDFDHMLLPDEIVLPMLWLGLLINIKGTFVSLDQAVIGAAVGYMSLYSVCWLFKQLTGKDGMGHGDFKLVALFGAWMGWQLLPLLILMASFVGAIVGIALMLFKNHQRGQAIPFGPYLAVSGWITLLWGEGVWQWYLNILL